MKKNWTKAMAATAISEGGFTHYRYDPGNWYKRRLIGTNHGISAPVLAQWLGYTPTMAEMKRLTKAEANEIYKAKYWDSLRCDNLPSGVDYTVFDYGVNSGISRSAKALQRVVGVSADGIVGGITLKMVGHKNPVYIIKEINRRRLAFLQRLRTWRHFGRGWTTRVTNVLSKSLAMAKGES